MKAGIISFFCLVIVFVVSPGYASPATEVNYLELMNSNIKDGSILIDSKITIELEFSGAFSSETLTAHNKQCLDLYLINNSGERQAIDFTVFPASENSNLIKIKPSNQLKSKAEYLLTINKKLKSITGKSLKDNLQINFKTKDQDDLLYYLALLIAIGLAAIYIFKIKK